VFARAIAGVRDADAIFSEYAYFSSYSTSWVEHARQYSKMAIARFGGRVYARRQREIAGNFLTLEVYRGFD
jgi:hypothetical protein